MTHNFIRRDKYPFEQGLKVQFDEKAVYFETVDIPPPARSETIREKIAYRWYGVKYYFSRLWAAILGKE